MQCWNALTSRMRIFVDSCETSTSAATSSRYIRQFWIYMSLVLVPPLRFLLKGSCQQSTAPLVRQVICNVLVLVPTTSMVSLLMSLIRLTMRPPVGHNTYNRQSPPSRRQNPAGPAQSMTYSSRDGDTGPFCEGPAT